MKCPFCQQELEDVGCGLTCLNCKKDGLNGDPDLWQELIDLMKEYDLCYDALIERTKEVDCTRKALDVAWDGLEKIGSGNIIEHSVVGHEDDNKIFIANKTLDESKKALEQKGKQ